MGCAVINFWSDAFLPILAAVLLWWGTTGVIIFMCGRKAWRPYVFAAVTLIQPFAFWQLHNSRDYNSVGDIFGSFFWAVVIWSWVECSYYTGFVVGRKVPELEPDAPVGKRFRAAVAANLYHELSIITLSVIVVVLGWGGINDTGLWTFMILHWAHQSAKINVFLGVNNLTTDFLPENLRYMAQYFVKKPLNSLFPFSVTVTTIIATFLFVSTLNTTTSGQLTGQCLLFVLMCAAIMEHWWLVTPVPTKIWDWSIKSRQKNSGEITSEPIPVVINASTPKKLVSNGPETQIICGYLGSGKTTLIRHLLPQLNERVAVVVNDFGAVGIDADVIKADGAAGAVVELPGGCVCCTLQKNLTGQILKLVETYRPERLLIEPSGVAGIEQILKAIASPRLLGKLGNVEVISVVEAPRLLNPHELPTFIQTQIKVATAVVINKTDLVAAADISRLHQNVVELNAAARVLEARHGQVEAMTLLGLQVPSEDFEDEEDENDHAELDELHAAEGGYISFGREYDGTFDYNALSRVFERMADGHFGPMSRAKGLFKTKQGWQLWELASGSISYELLPNAPYPNSQPSRFMAVAADLASDELHRQLIEAATPLNSMM